MKEIAGTTRRKLTYQVGFLYLIMNLVSISLFTYVLSNNQIELISENTRFKAIEITQSLSQILNSELNEKADNLNEIIEQAFANQNIPYLILHNDSIQFQSANFKEIPADLTMQIAKSMSIKEYSGAPFHLNFNSADRVLDFYIPLNRMEQYIVVGRIELSEFNDRFTALYQSIIVTIVALMIMYLLFGGLLHQSVIRPLVKLFEATDKVAQGKFDFRVDIKRKDEIGALADRFNLMTETIEKTMDSLSAQMKKIEAAKRQIEKMAVTDELTKLYNRRYLYDKLNYLIDMSQRYKTPLGLIILDVDFFKKVNDTYGHQTGDSVLKIVSLCLKKSCRSTDIVARYGGEEMVIVCPQTNLEQTELLAQRINKAIEKVQIKLPEGVDLKITASLGVSELLLLSKLTGKTQHSPTDLIEAADQALYNAKHNGRNRVEILEALLANE